MFQKRIKGKSLVFGLQLLILLLFTILLSTTTGLRSAEADEPNTNPTLYYGYGAEGWTLYTHSDIDDGLSNPYRGGEGTWEAGEGYLTLSSFSYSSGSDQTSALVIKGDCIITLNGTNSLHAEANTSDSLCLETWGNVSIQGSGSLSITTADTTSRTVGIKFSKTGSTFSVDEASISILTGVGGAKTFGIEGTSGNQIIISNGARVSCISGDARDSSEYYPSYGILLYDAAENFITIDGVNSSLIATGGVYAIYNQTSSTSTAPSLGSTYGVYAANGYNDNGHGNSGFGIWTDSGYYKEQNDQKARFVQMGEKPTITTDTLDYAVLKEPYSFTLGVHGDEDSEYQWTIYPQSGSATSLAIDRGTGTLSDTPTSLGKGELTIYAHNQFGSTRKGFDFEVYSRYEEYADSDLNGMRKGKNCTGSGTSSDPFRVQINTNFNIEAFGDRQDLSYMVPGDTRFIPHHWAIDGANAFGSSAPYLLSTQLSEAKTYMLTIAYREERWNGSSWEETGEYVSKTAIIEAVTYSVSDDETGDQDGAPLAKAGDSQFPAAQILSVVASFCLLGGLFAGYQRKRAHR